MAHTNQTPNYELSQFLGTDKPAWLVDYNGDMEKIDLGLKAAKDVADAAKAEADQGALDIAAVTVTANSADAKASGAISDLADAYDATSTYNVGDFVIYNNILYRCITTISVPESFDGTHWVRTTVEEITEQITSELANKQDTLTLENVAFSPVTVNTVSITNQQGKKYGKYVKGWATFSTTSTIPPYGGIINLPYATSMAGDYALCDADGVTLTTAGLYTDAGNTQLRTCKSLPAGTYRVTFSYLIN